jgi:hypothetical protein
VRLDGAAIATSVFAARARLLRGRRARWRFTGLGLAVIAVAAGIAIMSAANDNRAVPAIPPTASMASSTPLTSAEAPKLVGTDWQLIEFTKNGHRTVVPDKLVSGLLFDGRGNYFLGACQGTSGKAVLDDRMVKLDGGLSTANACGGLEGEVGAAVHGFIGLELDWSIDQQRLTLRAPGGDALVYRVRIPTPDPHTTVVIAGERDGHQYRVEVYGSGDRSGVELHVSADPWPGWRGGSMLATPIGAGVGVETLLFHEVGNAYLIAGVVPTGVVQVVHHGSANGSDTVVPVHPVDGHDWAVFAGFVPDHTDTSTITAYDADGQVVATWSRDR